MGLVTAENRQVNAVDFKELDARRKAIESAFPDQWRLRMRRAVSWIECAEKASNDDSRFIFYWIAFNAACGRRDLRNAGRVHEEYFDTILRLDSNNAIHDTIWKRFHGPVRVFLDNHFVFDPFWKHHHGEDAHDWEIRFESSKRRAYKALGQADTKTILSILFDRLYVLRNQLMHGGATWNGKTNRDQIRDGSRIMAFLVPLFIWLMMSDPKVDWGPPYYPFVDRQVHWPGER